MTRPTLTLFVVALGVTATLSARPSEQSPSGDFVTLTVSSELVPFCADVLNTYTTHISTGTFHRRSDGSTAMVLNTPAGVALTIHNLARRRTYVRLGEQEWKFTVQDEAALSPPPGNLRFRRDEVQLIPDPQLGDVYEHTSPRTGTVIRFAMGLNGFRVMFRQPNGVGHEFLNIQLGEQPDELFVPPPDGTATCFDNGHCSCGKRQFDGGAAVTPRAEQPTRMSASGRTFTPFSSGGFAAARGVV